MMQIMKRPLALLLILALCLSSALWLSSCHGSRQRDAFEIPESFDANRKYEITFWAKNDTNKAQTAVYKKAIEDFQAVYPNITVNLLLYTDYNRIYNDVITNISTGTTPNVCITYPDHIATYMTGENVIVPLDGLMEDPRYGLGGSELKYDGPTRDELVAPFLEECVIDGAHVALPYMRSTEALYINKTYVEKLGYTVPDVPTWDWIFEVSEKAALKDGDGVYAVNGQKVMIPFIYKSTDNMMIQMLRQRGAGYATEAGEVLLFNDVTEEILYTVAGHVKTGAFSTFKISSYPANFLNAGQCIFAIDSTAGSTWMGSEAPLLDISEDQLVPFETVVRPIPQYDTQHPTMISQGPSVCLFNKGDAGEVLASWLFLQFLLTNGVQMGYAETEGYVPVTTKAQNDPAYVDYLSRRGEDNGEHYAVKIDATRLLIDNTDNTFTTPVFNGSASLRNAAGQMIENVAKSVRRKETVDDAYMQKLQTDMTAQYRLDQIGAGTGHLDRESLGPLPTGARALLLTLGGVWLLLGGVALYGFLKNYGKKQ